MTGAGFSFEVERPSVGRPGRLQLLNARLQGVTLGAVYRSGPVTESFRSTAAGIEHSFVVSKEPAGRGPLVVEIPISGMKAITDASGVHLVDGSGATKAAYSGLRVTDSSGRRLSASESAVPGGRGVSITVDDSGASYPVLVDPVWSQVQELTGTGLVRQDQGFVESHQVAMSGQLMAAGDPARGKVYVYKKTGSAWGSVTTITPTGGADAAGYFGFAVAVVGNWLIVGAPRDGGANTPGGVYVFSLVGGSWVQQTEWAFSTLFWFGMSLNASGNSLVIGSASPLSGPAQDQHVGEVLISTLSGSSWSTPTALPLAPNQQQNDGINGVSVSISGSHIAVGVPNAGAAAQTCFGERFVGAVYLYSFQSGSWSFSQGIVPPGTDYPGFGDDVSLSGSHLLVGASTYNCWQGAAYAYTFSNGMWQSDGNPLTGSDTQSSNGCCYGGSNFGYSVSLQGNNALIGAYGGTQQGSDGTAYLFQKFNSGWQQDSPDLSDSDSVLWFGSSVLLSGATGVVQANNAVYFEALTPEVQPVGSPLGADTRNGATTTAPAMCQCGPTSVTPSVGGPINTATGDATTAGTDLRLPGAGVPLAFTRTYDAQAAQTEINGGSSVPALGYGWSDNLGMTVAYNSTTGTATVSEASGAQTTFTAYQAGTSPAWCSGSTNFCPTAPRFEASLNQNTGGGWTFVRDTDPPTTYTFGSSGVLTTITDTAGNTLTEAAYSPSGGQTACPIGDICTAWTSSASGRELVLATTTSGQLTAVFDANSTLQASFSYSGTGCSTWSTGAPDLCQAVDPGGLTYAYTYDSANATAAYEYDLTSELHPGWTSPMTNVYDTTGRVTQQTDSAGQVTALAYSGTNSSLAGGTTTVTDYPDGTGTGKPQDTTVYGFSSNVLVAETTGAGTTSASTTTFIRDPVSLMPIATQDANGNSGIASLDTYNQSGATGVSSADVLASTDALGNVTQAAYNSLNQPWCNIDAADSANGKTCPSSPPSSPPVPGASDPNLGASIGFYNSSDQLTATTDALGNTSTYSYTSGVSGVPNGLRYCTVDPVDYQKSVTCPAYGAPHVTGTTTATFDAAGDRLTSSDADGNTTSYVYGAAGHPGLVSSITDPDGTTTSYIYNGAGKLTASTVAFGSYTATTTTAYDTLGRPYCTVSAYEISQSVACPSSPPSSPPTPSNDPYLGATITTYDADGRVVQSTNPLGGITLTAYDLAGEPFCTVAPAEAAVNVTCPSTPPTTAPTPSSDPYLGATITTYDANGRVVQTTNPLGGITLTSYDPAGSPSQTTVESNNTTSAPNVVTDYSYDADNRTIGTTVNPGGSLPATTVQAYDPNGNLFCTVSANAVASTTYQCPAWQPSWITSPPAPSSLYSSTPSLSQANQVTTSFSNADGQQTQTTDADFHTTIIAVDGDSRPYCTADPTNLSTWLTAHPTSTYPYLCPSSPPTSPPAQGSDPGYNTTIIDAAGRTLSSTDPLGDTTTYTYTPVGQRLTVVDPRGETTTNCFYYQNISGSCAAAAPTGGGSGDSLYSTTTPATSADPSGETTSYTYFPGGSPQTVTTPAGKTTYSYDAAIDRAAINYSNTATGYSTPANTSYAYNVDGTRHTMTDGTGTTTYGYDAAGNITSQALTAAGGSGLSNQTVSYSYYDTTALASMTYPAYRGHASPQVSYAYDPTGAMALETDWLGNQITFGHDRDGNPTSQDNNVSTGNPAGTSSTTSSYDNADINTAATTTINQTCGGPETLTQSFSGTGGSRNPDSQLTQYTASYSATCSGQTSIQRNYSYDQAGHVTYQGNSSQGANPSSFGYDPSGDPTTLSSHDGGGNFDTYTQTFDNAGEITAQTPVSGSGGVASSYTYDTLGDQTQASAGTNTTSQSFNQIGQIRGATTPSSSASYLYNGDGLSASTTTATTSQFTWDSTRSLSTILSDGTNDYIYGAGAEPVEQVALSTTTPTYLTYTPSNSTWISTNQAGVQTGYWGYDAYGTPAFGSPTTSFGYSGQYVDTTTGLVNDRARFYQPQSGGFTTRDPLFSRTDTAYTYAGGDSVNRSDPTGLMEEADGGGGFGPNMSAACEQAMVDEITQGMWFSQLPPKAQNLFDEYVGQPNPDQVNSARTIYTDVVPGANDVPHAAAALAWNATTSAPNQLVELYGPEVIELGNGASAFVGPAGAAEDLIGQGAEAAGASGRSVDEVLNRLPKGNQSFVRTVPDEGSLQSTFDELTQGGTPTTWKGYDGSVYELPDGTQIGMRDSSTSGGATIDIRNPDGSINKIHIAP